MATTQLLLQPWCGPLQARLHAPSAPLSLARPRRRSGLCSTVALVSAQLSALPLLQAPALFHGAQLAPKLVPAAFLLGARIPCFPLPLPAERPRQGAAPIATRAAPLLAVTSSPVTSHGARPCLDFAQPSPFASRGLASPGRRVPLHSVSIRPRPCSSSPWPPSSPWSFLACALLCVESLLALSSHGYHAPCSNLFHGRGNALPLTPLARTCPDACAPLVFPAAAPLAGSPWCLPSARAASGAPRPCSAPCTLSHSLSCVELPWPSDSSARPSHPWLRMMFLSSLCSSGLASVRPCSPARARSRRARPCPIRRARSLAPCARRCELVSHRCLVTEPPTPSSVVATSPNAFVAWPCVVWLVVLVRCRVRLFLRHIAQ
jgi:hypothetical protein